MILSRIVSAGAAFPDGKLTNAELADRFEKPVDYFFEKTGIRERTIAGSDCSTLKLAIDASQKALKDSKFSPEDIELLVVGTVTPSFPLPSEACVLQKYLNMKNAVGFDVAAACSGWLFALNVADNFIKGQSYKNALVVGADTLSKLTDSQDRSTSMLFGDGAGATLLEKIEVKDKSELENIDGPILLDISLRTIGEGYELFMIPNGGTMNPLDSENVNSNKRFMQMKGMEVFRHSINSMTGECKKILERNNLEASDISLFIPHQANINIAKHVADKLGIPFNKVLNNIEFHGNVSSACLPTAFERAMREKKAPKGSYVLISAFGAGFTTGSALFRW